MLWKVPAIDECTPPIIMEQVTDPVELARARAQREKFDRNWAWYQQHVMEIGETHRGKCICIAGQEVFGGDTPEEAIALAKAAHPEDNGRFTCIIPRDKAARIYSLALTPAARSEVAP